MPEAQKRSKVQMNLWVHPGVKERAEALADRMGLNRSDMVELAIRRLEESERLPVIEEELRALRSELAAVRERLPPTEE